MDKFFAADSVAVMGVSNSPSNLGRAMVYNLMEFRYQGCIYLVGPKGGSFLGHKIYPSILDVPEAVDLATILIPAAAVPEALRQCGEKGVKRVVLQSAGFGELGEDRRRLEEEIRRIVQHYQMRLIGPNCIGVINRQTGLAVPFMPMRAEAPAGRISIISQSGGVGAMMLNTLATEHLGFNKFVSIGNKLNVNESDLMEYFIEDSQTQMVFCYLEGIAEGRRLMEIAGRSGKPIVVHKSNKGGAGAIIAKSHSASLSTDDAVVSAAFRQCGIVRVAEQREAAECLKAFSLPRMKGRRLAVISRSGGHAVMAADAADEYGFTLPPFPGETLRLVEEHSRAKVIQFHNPMDLGDLFDLPLYRKLADLTLARDDVDGLLFVHNYQGVVDAEPSRNLIASLGEVIAQSHKPLALCVFTTESELVENRRGSAFPIFTDPREAVRALARNRDWQPAPAPPFARQRPEGMDRDRVRAEFEAVLGSSGQLSPDKVAHLLGAYGVALIPWELALNADAAVAAAERLSFPVVMKTGNAAIIHKSDVGGVLLNLENPGGVRNAYQTLTELGGQEVLVAKMAGPGLEWFVGGRQDEHFGPVVVVGSGGIYVEIFRETAIRVAPVTHQEAFRLLEECRGAPLLAGARGQEALDRESLADLVVRVSWLLHDFPEIRELDLNPIRIFAAGEGCCALDWRATVAPQRTRP
jgi:acetate---CoA ligase (ADP-forming)